MLVPAIATGTASAAKSKSNPLIVCKHGCKYRTIQSAVNKSGKNATIKVKPGRYVEGVLVEGHKHDGLQIIGTGKNAGAVVLDGKNAKTANGSSPRTGSKATASTIFRSRR